MIRNTTRKMPRARSSETDKSRGAKKDELKRTQYPAQPRRPSRLLLAFSAALFLVWLIALVLLAIWLT